MNTPTRPVRRRFDLGERRPIVVTLLPNGVVQFREKGRRTTYEAHLRTLFGAAVRYAVAEARKEKLAQRAARRAARRNG